MIDASVTEGEEGEQGGGEGGERECGSGNKGGKLSDGAIVSHSVTFLLAGYETTANTLAYTSYLLALHPDVQDRLRAEIDEYFHSNPVCRHVLTDSFRHTLPCVCIWSCLYN